MRQLWCSSDGVVFNDVWKHSCDLARRWPPLDSDAEDYRETDKRSARVAVEVQVEETVCPTNVTKGLKRYYETFSARLMC